MIEPRTLRLQRALASLILDADEDSMENDPGQVARRQALPAADQEAFRAQREALLTYRELARMSLLEPLEDLFPRVKALLEEADLWDSCVQAFLDARRVQSPHYRDLAPAFLGWLMAAGWGQERWPFLLELAHCELLELLVGRFPDSEPPQDVHAEPGLSDGLVLEPATQIVSYAHAVHCVQEGELVPDAKPTHLLAFRKRNGEVQLMDLTPATAALLVQAQSATLGDVFANLNLPEPTPAMLLLRDLCRDGALVGFRNQP